MKRRLAQTIPMSPPRLNNLAVLYQRARPLCRGRATLPARPHDWRKSAGPRPSRCRRFAQQPRRLLPCTGALCRGRTALLSEHRYLRRHQSPDRPPASAFGDQPSTITRASARETGKTETEIEAERQTADALGGLSCDARPSFEARLRLAPQDEDLRVLRGALNNTAFLTHTLLS